MAFYGLKFIYDNIPSDSMGLYIGEFGGNSVKNSPSSTKRELVYEHNEAREENLIFGTKTSSDLLEFDLGVFSYEQLSRQEMERIERWLFYNDKPKKLVICQDDMYQYHYNAIITGEWISVGNMSQGLQCKVQCDSQYGYSNRVTMVIPKGTRTVRNASITKMIYPKIEFTCTKANGSISIKNVTENRTFTMTGLQLNEKITIDKWFQITSSTGLLRLSNCNREWLRLLSGMNKLEVQGDVANIKLEYIPKHAISG